ncbi:hypothetical protein QUA37_26220 [Microcoleus sp. Pol12A6]|uniref:hypothetical protein n=1 Tax=Microcoleus sp. Pol12B3 TaxID=3055394 RepID=UPI002FD5339D
MLKLDRLGNWYKFVVFVGETHFIDCDSSIPVSICLKNKEFYIEWWDARKERIAKRMSKMLLEL